MSDVLITGITGQDGRTLAKMLLDDGHTVYGLVRGQNNPKEQIVRDTLPGVKLIHGDLTDYHSLIRAIEVSRPELVFNLGAISFVHMSWSQPELTANITGLGPLRLMDALRTVAGGVDGYRIYQASSSEMFGEVGHYVPQNEDTPFHPRSPYGSAKAFAHYSVQNYRESYGMFAVSGILFNHEGPLRGPEFVTRKITLAAARIKAGLQDKLVLGNLDSKRDWGHSEDYMRAAYLILTAPTPKDYVVATGETHSIREFLTRAFERAELDGWANYVEQDPRFMRPAEVDLLLGDSSRIRADLGWVPFYGFEDLVDCMVDNDLALVGQL